MVYGYCRVATKKQNIERQMRNILKYNTNAKIITETFTGTRFIGRKQFIELVERLKEGDTLIFDSVSIMSRNAREGIALYKELYYDGINLVFIKEPHINTETYKTKFYRSIKDNDAMTRKLDEYILDIAKQQIRLAFEQAEKEVKDLSQRTKEGIETARLNGKQIGHKKGSVFAVKKAIISKDIILKHNKTFGGTLSDAETQKLCGISRNSLYLYKRELKQEIEAQESIEEVIEKYKELAQKYKEKEK